MHIIESSGPGQTDEIIRRARQGDFEIVAWSTVRAKNAAWKFEVIHRMPLQPELIATKIVDAGESEKI